MMITLRIHKEYMAVFYNTHWRSRTTLPPPPLSDFLTLSYAHIQIHIRESYLVKTNTEAHIQRVKEGLKYQKKNRATIDLMAEAHV